MFESTIDLTEIRSVLTDAGHTVVGFATLALKKGNDVRLDTAKTFGSQIGDLRLQALALVEKVDETATELEERFEPLVSRMSERLPAPAASAALTLQQQGRALRHKATDVVVSALRSDASPVATSRPGATRTATAPVKTAKKTTKKTTTAKKPVAKAAAKATPKASTAPKSVKKTVKTTVEKTAAKATATKSAVKASARKASATK